MNNFLNFCSSVPKINRHGHGPLEAYLFLSDLEIAVKIFSFFLTQKVKFPNIVFPKKTVCCRTLLGQFKRCDTSKGAKMTASTVRSSYAPNLFWPEYLLGNLGCNINKTSRGIATTQGCLRSKKIKYKETVCVSKPLMIIESLIFWNNIVDSKECDPLWHFSKLCDTLYKVWIPLHFMIFEQWKADFLAILYDYFGI